MLNVIKKGVKKHNFNIFHLLENTNLQNFIMKAQ